MPLKNLQHMTMLYLGSMQQGPKAITPIMLECSFHKKNSKKNLCLASLQQPVIRQVVWGYM